MTKRNAGMTQPLKQWSYHTLVPNHKKINVRSCGCHFNWKCNRTCNKYLHLLCWNTLCVSPLKGKILLALMLKQWVISFKFLWYTQNRPENSLQWYQPWPPMLTGCQTATQQALVNARACWVAIWHSCLPIQHGDFLLLLSFPNKVPQVQMK